MHLYKWMRKNKKKIMAFVVIFLMISFVVGYAGLQLFIGLLGRDNPVIGTLEDGQRIRARDYLAAQNELRLLQMLGGDMVLMAQGQQGLAGPLMAHLLFPDSRVLAENLSPADLKRAAQAGQIPVDVALIDDFFDERPQPELAWILLQAEAHSAGSAISEDNARNTLLQIMPHLAEGADPAQVYRAIIRETNLPEEQIVRTFADFLGVMFYINNITDNQLVTLNQLQAALGRSHEQFDAEWVEIAAGWFIDEDSPVEQDAMRQQFEAYNDVMPGLFSDDNPFGFGYKLPKRIQLEYITVLLDDVKTQITRPTSEQMEEFYSRNIERFRYQEPADPADPEGEQVTRTRSFSEALPQIRQQMQQERINRLAMQIFNDARTMTEEEFFTINLEEADFEQFQAVAGDYAQAAEDLSQQYNVQVLTGRTGLLSRADFQDTDILSMLQVQHGQRSTALSEVVFTVRRDPRETPSAIGGLRARPWENIGPMTGGHYDQEAQEYHRLMTMVRVVDIQEAEVPATMDISFPIHGMNVLPSQRQDEQPLFSLADQIASDIRTRRAMEQAETFAQDLTTLVQDLGWNEAIATFNEKLAEHDIPLAELETIRDQRRLPQTERAQMLSFIERNPAAAAFLQDRLATSARNEKIHRLLPDSQASVDELAEVVSIEKKAACYVVKRVDRKPATEADYLENKMEAAFQANMTATIEPVLIHLLPRNLLARTGYEATDERPIIDDSPPPAPPTGGGF